MERFVTVDECQKMIDAAVAETIRKLSRTGLRPYKVFGLNSTKDYAKRVVGHLGVNLTTHTEKCFDDGECYLKSGPEYSDSSEGNVRGHNVFVIQSLYSDKTESVADKLLKLMTFCGSLRDASAATVNAVIPHLAYARQDRKTESRAPITTKYIAQMLESVGVTRVILMDVHNLSAIQNAFNIGSDNLEGKNLFAEWCATRLVAENKTKNIKVLTPDSGGLSRAERFRNALLKRLRSMGVVIDDIEVVAFDKLRIKGEVRGGRIIGDVDNAEVIAYDDMISTFGTMKKACKAVLESKGRLFAVCASHGLFCGKANEYLEELDTKIVVLDTVVPWRLNEVNLKKVHIVDTTKMVADAIQRIHSETGSISELLKI